jgi:hypothetical protein
MDDSEGRHGALGCVFWAGLLVLVVVVIVVWSGPSILHPGQIVLLRSKAKEEAVYVGPTEADGQELKTLIQAGDDLGIGKMESGGSLFPVASETRCRVIEHDWLKSLYRVRVLEGQEKGKSGWVYSRFLSAPPK